MKKRSINTTESVKVVTANNFVTAMGLQNLTLKALKLLYIAIAQVKKSDKEFYEFVITPLEFAEIMGVDVSNIYDEAEKICDELTPLWIKVRDKNGKGATNYTVFSKVKYSDNSDIVFKLNKDMSDFLLELKEHFTQPLLLDFVKMRSTYSMEIWHLMQLKMKSRKPMINHPIEFEISLQELREVTGTDTKKVYDKLSNFKDKILDKAIREIKDFCGVEISYTYIKDSKKVIGFHFVAKSIYEPVEPFDVFQIEEIENRAKVARQKGGLLIEINNYEDIKA